MIDTDYIRKFVKEVYVQPALRRGDEAIAIPVKAVEARLKDVGFISGRTPMVCSALSGKKFQKENGIVLDHWEGPASGQSTTVVFHYRFTGARNLEDGASHISMQETPAQRAFRLTERLRGLMKDEIATHGGAEGFMRWVRSDEDEA